MITKGVIECYRSGMVVHCEFGCSPGTRWKWFILNSFWIVMAAGGKLLGRDFFGNIALGVLWTHMWHVQHVYVSIFLPVFEKMGQSAEVRRRLGQVRSPARISSSLCEPSLSGARGVNQWVATISYAIGTLTIFGGYISWAFIIYHRSIHLDNRDGNDMKLYYAFWPCWTEYKTGSQFLRVTFHAGRCYWVGIMVGWKSGHNQLHFFKTSTTNHWRAGTWCDVDRSCRGISSCPSWSNLKTPQSVCNSTSTMGILNWFGWHSSQAIKDAERAFGTGGYEAEGWEEATGRWWLTRKFGSSGGSQQIVSWYLDFGRHGKKMISNISWWILMPQF